MESPIQSFAHYTANKEKVEADGDVRQNLEVSESASFASGGILDFLILMKKSEIILTDSGGVLEKATAPR